MSGPFADKQLAEFAALPAPAFADLDVAAMRKGIAQRAQGRPSGPQLHAVSDLRISGLLARLYRPAPDALPLVVYLHGGGWTVGDLDSFDRVCRRLAEGCGAAVLALDYRLAPENPWPASVDDVVATLRWVASSPADLGESPSAVAVAGDSAGGTLAALACLRLRDEQPEALPDLQVLIYANTDLTGSRPSMRSEMTGGGVDAETERFFISQWVPDQARWGDPDVSPLHAPDLSCLPSALIVSAELDPLRDDSQAYAERLRQADVEVELRCEPGMIHNFLQLDEISLACAAAADRIAADIHARLSAPDKREESR